MPSSVASSVWPVSALRHRSVRGGVPAQQRRNFLTLLATALHAYGSSAARTEYLIEQAASTLGVDVAVAVFPTLVLLSFGEGHDDGCRSGLGHCMCTWDSVCSAQSRTRSRRQVCATALGVHLGSFSQC